MIFSLEELKDIEKDCAIYVGRMERVARHSSISKEEKVREGRLGPRAFSCASLSSQGSLRLPLLPGFLAPLPPAPPSVGWTVGSPSAQEGQVYRGPSFAPPVDWGGV